MTAVAKIVFLGASSASFGISMFRDLFSSRDLADMRADRSEMLYQVHKQIYG